MWKRCEIFVIESQNTYNQQFKNGLNHHQKI